MNIILERTLKSFVETSCYEPRINSLNSQEWDEIFSQSTLDYQRHYQRDLNFNEIRYFRGAIATFFYRISQFLYLKEQEEHVLEFSSLGTFFSNSEIYYTSDISKSLKINHAIGTVVGAKTKIEDKNGERPIIGNNVVIYSGAVVVGDIQIGDNCIIEANTFVDKSYPANSIIR